jgi:anti-anti-sigma factor
MSIKCDEFNQICVITPLADFTADSAAQAKKAVEDHIDQRHIIDFVVDMQKTTFMDSDGLEALLWIKRRCEDLFGQIRLANLDENCRKILEITRLEHRFQCTEDLATALKTMR